MQLLIRPDGVVQALYSEEFELAALGRLGIRRASYVEPQGHLWYADLSLSGGPRLGPFATRSQAIGAETRWLEEHVL